MLRIENRAVLGFDRLHDRIGKRQHAKVAEGQFEGSGPEAATADIHPGSPFIN
jgi:hypothetical protein